MANPSIASEQMQRTLSFFGDGDMPLALGEANALPLLRPAAVERLARKLDVAETRLLDVSSIPTRTFHRRQKLDQPLSATESDRLLRIARVASEAVRVLGSEEKARRWLSKDNRLLGAQPLELLATDGGACAVEAELHRIDWGDFS
jgi:putative toxin-antitoxin system antitoxin component (TIGR02293 family)